MNESDLLNTLRTLNNVASLLQTKVYVWGGLTQDLYEGKFLREHSDVDCFMLEGNKTKDELATFFQHEGWNVLDMNGVLSIKKEGSKIHLGHIEPMNASLMKYTFYEGALFITFPTAWLKKEPFMFYGIPVDTTEPEFEYAIRIGPMKLNPLQELREKDTLAVQYFEKRLTLKGENLDNVLANMHIPLELVGG